MWRDWVARSESQWSEATNAMLRDPQSGGVLNKQVEEVRLAQRQFAEAAQAGLAFVNLPSRTDLEALDDRMGRLEDALAQVCAEVVRLREALVLAAPLAAVAPARPARTRRAPASASASASAPASASAKR